MWEGHKVRKKSYFSILYFVVSKQEGRFFFQIYLAFWDYLNFDDLPNFSGKNDLYILFNLGGAWQPNTIFSNISLKFKIQSLGFQIITSVLRWFWVLVLQVRFKKIKKKPFFSSEGQFTFILFYSLDKLKPKTKNQNFCCCWYFDFVIQSKKEDKETFFPFLKNCFLVPTIQIV